MALESIQGELASELFNAVDIVDGPSDAPLLIPGPGGEGFRINAEALIALRTHLATASKLIDQLQQML